MRPLLHEVVRQGIAVSTKLWPEFSDTWRDPERANAAPEKTRDAPVPGSSQVLMGKSSRRDAGSFADRRLILRHQYNNNLLYTTARRMKTQNRQFFENRPGLGPHIRFSAAPVRVRVKNQDLMRYRGSFRLGPWQDHLRRTEQSVARSKAAGRSRDHTGWRAPRPSSDDC